MTMLADEEDMEPAGYLTNGKVAWALDLQLARLYAEKVYNPPPGWEYRQFVNAGYPDDAGCFHLSSF